MLVERPRLTRWMWLGGAVASIWAWPILKAALTPASVRAPLEAGFIQSFTSLDRSMAIGGLGLAVGLMPRARHVALTALLVATLVSFWSTPPLLLVFQAWQGMWAAIGLIGPLGLVAAGLGLLLSQRAKAAMLPLLAALVGFGIGISIEVNRPAGDPIFGFAFGSMYSSFGIWLFAVYAMFVKSLDGSPGTTWMMVGTRIGGSWLIAIGLLLGGLVLLPPKIPVETMVPILLPRQIDESAQP